MADRWVGGVLRCYPREWHRDGRVAEIDEILRETLVHRGRRDVVFEVSNLAGHALTARARNLAPVAVRIRVSAVSTAFGGALAAVSFLMGEWQPWASTDRQPTFGPFETWGSIYCLAWILLVAAQLMAARRTVMMVSVATLLIGLGCAAACWTTPRLWPSAYQARPALSLIISLVLFNVGVCWGLSVSSARRRRCAGGGGVAAAVSLVLLTYDGPLRGGSTSDERWAWLFRRHNDLDPFVRGVATLAQLPMWIGLMALIGFIGLVAAQRLSLAWWATGVLGSLPVLLLHMWHLPDRQRPAAAAIVTEAWLSGAVVTVALARRYDRGSGGGERRSDGVVSHASTPSPANT